MKEPDELFKDGEVKETGRLPDGSGYALVSIPLREDHWIYGDATRPPMPFRLGTHDRVDVTFIRRHPDWDSRYGGFPSGARVEVSRAYFADCIRVAARHAVKAATMSGKEMDFDPDALVQNMVVGMLGYFTESGLSGEDWMNPEPLEEGAEK